LVTAFGFERHLVVDGEGDSIEHAQLTHGTGMVMLGSDRPNEYGEYVSAGSHPSPVGLYVIVDDVDAHADRARAAGAEILMEPEDQDYGGRSYTARDPEGNVWSFGSYDPWAEHEA
jgi:uncharacterized glyoxalase superfamily protein PhnB